MQSIGVNLIGFRKFELLRGESEGPGGGGGPGDAGGTVGFAEAGRGGSPSSAPGVDAGFGVSGTAAGGPGQGGGYMSGSQGAISDSLDNYTGAGNGTMGVSPGDALAQVGITSFGDIADETNVDIAGFSPSSLAYATELGIGTAPGAAAVAQAEDAQAQEDAQAASISFTPSINDLEALSTSPVDLGAGSGTGIDFTPGIQGLTSPSGNLSIDAIASFNEAMSNQNPNNPAAAESLIGAPVGTGTPSFVSGMDAVDATISPVSETDAFLGNLTTGAKVDTDTLDAMYDSSLGTLPSSDSLYGTSPLTGQQVTAMSPAKAAAMTGGVPGTMTGMNLAQDQNSLEASKQAAAMDVLGAQIGAGNLTGNEDIDQVNIELAKQGVQIDTSGLPGILGLGTGVNALNQNYQLSQNQDILTQLAQGTGNDDATNTGILGTGIGAVKGVNTYKPAYNAQGQIVGSVATDAAGNAVGGPAGITTNVVGGLKATPDLYSDAAGTQLYTGANEAVGDFKEMAAASQSSDEGPPEDVTSVDANGCKIGSEFFNGQRCQPIETNTGDGTGGATGGAYTPYKYQTGQGTMLNPDFSDMYTSNVKFNTLNPNAGNMNFLRPAVNPYGNFAGGGIVPMMRNYSVR